STISLSTSEEVWHGRTAGRDEDVVDAEQRTDLKCHPEERIADRAEVKQDDEQRDDRKLRKADRLRLQRVREPRTQNAEPVEAGNRQEVEQNSNDLDEAQVAESDEEPRVCLGDPPVMARQEEGDGDQQTAERTPDRSRQRNQRIPYAAADRRVVDVHRAAWQPDSADQQKDDRKDDAHQ